MLASAEVAPDRRSRARGLLGRDGIDGALVIDPCRWIHTVGMRFPIDVAYLDADGVVVKAVRMRRRRVGLPVFAARRVIEAEAGAFARWGLHVGCTIEVRGDQQPPTHESAATSTGDADTVRPGVEPGRPASAGTDPAPPAGEAGGTSDAARTAADDTVGRDRRRADGAPRPDREAGDNRRIAVLVAAP